MEPQTAEEIVAEAFSESLGGKAFGESKVRSTWSLSIGGKSYNVEFANSKASGMKRVFVNGQLQHERKVLLSPTFTYKWRLDGHSLSIVPKDVVASVDCSFDLCIDGRPFQAYQRRKLLASSRKQDRTPLETHAVGQRNRRSSSEHSIRVVSTDKPRSCLKREGSDRKRSVSFKLRTGQHDHSRTGSSRDNKENDAPKAAEPVSGKPASAAQPCLDACKESLATSAVAQGGWPVPTPAPRDGPLTMEAVPAAKQKDAWPSAHSVVEPRPGRRAEQTNPFVLFAPDAAPAVGTAVSAAGAEHVSTAPKQCSAPQASEGTQSAADSQRSSPANPWAPFVATTPGSNANVKHDRQQEQTWPSKPVASKAPGVEQSRWSSPGNPWAPTTATAPCTAPLAAGSPSEAKLPIARRRSPGVATVDTSPAASPPHADPWKAWPAVTPSVDGSGWGVERDGGWPVADANSGSA